MRTYCYVLKRVRSTFPQDATPEELAIVGEHWERLLRLHAEGTLSHAGRTESLDFALAIFTAESDEAADALVRGDPCVREGLMTAELHPYQVLLPQER